MTNKELANFFRKSNIELDQIVVDIDNIDVNVLDSWKINIVNKLRFAYRIKMNRLEIFIINNYDYSVFIDIHKLNIAKTILRDMYFKYNINKKNTKENIEILKLLKARENNIDFELNLAAMITGSNMSFPDRAYAELTKFFQDLGYNFVYNNSTKDGWTKEMLEVLNIKEIHHLLSHGLFKKKYFEEAAATLNFEVISREELRTDADSLFNIANKEFKEFIKKSISANESFDLSAVLDMNVNVELLFDNKVSTADKELNKLIEEAKDRFLNRDDKQIALEKLWDAFERLKTFFSDIEKKGKDKNKSAAKIVETISKDFDKDFINDEFKKLSSIGNDYRIRHHEQNKLELTSNHINYFFFRMLTLIDLCLVYLNEENE